MPKDYQVEVHIVPKEVEKVPAIPIVSKQNLQRAESDEMKHTKESTPQSTPEEEEEEEIHYPHFNKLKKTASEVIYRDHHKLSNFPMIAVSKTNDDLVSNELKKSKLAGFIEVCSSFFIQLIIIIIFPNIYRMKLISMISTKSIINVKEIEKKRPRLEDFDC